MNEINKYITKLSAKQSLTQEESSRAFRIMLLGGATPAQIAALLVFIKMKGESKDEIIGSIQAIKAKTHPIKTPKNSIDFSLKSIEEGAFISLATSLVVAGCSVPVALQTGLINNSSFINLLSQLGIKININASVIEESLIEANIAYIISSKFYPEIKNIYPVLDDLNIDNLFYIIGSLCNPTISSNRLIYINESSKENIIKFLQQDNYNKVWLITNQLGYFSIEDNNYITELTKTGINFFELSPADAGIKKQKIQDMNFGDIKYKAQMIMELLQGNNNIYRDLILFNSSASLLLANKTNNIIEAMDMAKFSLDSGKAHIALKKLVEIYNK